MRSAASVALAVLLAGVPAAARAGTRDAGRAERAEAAYERGVNDYAAGRFDAARRRFTEALRLDPAHRAARASLARLSVEIRGRELDAAPLPAPRPPLAAESNLLDELSAFLAFEDTLGDAASGLGGAQAALGRVAQLTAERRVARARGRPFDRDEELHALSRRLATAAS